MKVGDLIKSLHDDTHRGIIMETNPEGTILTHPDGVCRIRWFDGEDTFEFFKSLEILSESR